MNEKLNQLLQAAILAVEPTISDDEWHTHVHDNAIQKKFAELIVRECMKVANTYQNRGGNCYVDNMIAEHFGIKG